MAAALPALGGRNRLRLNTGRRSGRRKIGVPLHEGRGFLGHLTPRLLPGAAEEEEGLLAGIHAVRSLAANPQALALLLESLGPEVLPILGRELMRRVCAKA